LVKELVGMQIPGSSESDATSTNVSAKAVNPISSTRVQFIVVAVDVVFCVVFCLGCGDEGRRGYGTGSSLQNLTVRCNINIKKETIKRRNSDLGPQSVVVYLRLKIKRCEKRIA